jgi:hypothetical protein
MDTDTTDPAELKKRERIFFRGGSAASAWAEGYDGPIDGHVVKVAAFIAFKSARLHRRLRARLAAAKAAVKSRAGHVTVFGDVTVIDDPRHDDPVTVIDDPRHDDEMRRLVDEMHHEQAVKAVENMSDENRATFFAYLKKKYQCQF